MRAKQMAATVNTAHRFAHDAMRTRFEAVLEKPGLGNADARAAAEEAWQEIDRVEATLSPFAESSDVFKLNQADVRAPVAIDPRTTLLLQAIATLHTTTAGAFDPTVGPLSQLLRGDRPPSDSAMQKARDSIGLQTVLAVDPINDRAAIKVPGGQLDPGGIGKGVALDDAWAVLEDLALDRFVVHGGTSSVIASGRWRVAIADPRQTESPTIDASEASPQTPAVAFVDLDDAALSVSAAQGRPFAWPDGSTAHIIDPRNGQPARGSLLAAVALFTDGACLPTGAAACAEAWSTALMVVGADGLNTLEHLYPGASALWLGEDGRIECLGDGFSVEGASLRRP